MTSAAVKKPLHQNLPHTALSHGVRSFDADSDAPCTNGFIALLEAFRATGGTAPGATVARLLEEHQGGQGVSLPELVYTRQLFGFDWRANFWIPMFQFQADDLVLKNAPQRVREALPTAWSRWAVACWFAAPNIHLNGLSPVDALDADLSAVLFAAAACDARGTSALFGTASASARAPAMRERRATARL